MKAFRTLKEFLVQNRRSYIIGIFFLISIDVAQLFVPKILKGLADAYENNLLTTQITIKFALLTIAAGAFIAFGRYMWVIHILGTCRTLEYYLRDRIFNKLLSLSPNFFNTHKTGDLMALATNDVNAVRTAAGQGIIMFVDSAVMIALSVVMMIQTTNLKLTMMALAILPILVLFVTKFGRVIHRRFKRVQESFGGLTDTVQEIFSGIRVVKSSAQDTRFFHKFDQMNRENYEKNVDLVKLQSFFRPFIVFISSISFLSVMYFGGHAVISKQISLGDFVAFNMYLDLLIWPLMAFGMVINVMQRGSASMERINELLNVEPEILDPYPNAEPIDLHTVEFKNVTYSYPNSEVAALQNVSFKLERGKKLAIIGRTGSGKTSVINLLLRFYDLTERDSGEILINDKPLPEVSLRRLRESIGVVPQDNFLFSQTIQENIAFSSDGSGRREDVIEMAKIADIHRNIIDFPEQYDTMLGERGVTLSGGQKQRTAIARAIYKHPQFLILDDSFSAVDTETEEEILNNLKKTQEDDAVILISHRVSTVKYADEIIVLEQGKIIERGNDAELMAKRGYYYELATKQKLEEEFNRKEVI